jgi:hypothetical protein
MRALESGQFKESDDVGRSLNRQTLPCGRSSPAVSHESSARIKNHAKIACALARSVAAAARPTEIWCRRLPEVYVTYIIRRSLKTTPGGVGTEEVAAPT